MASATAWAAGSAKIGYNINGANGLSLGAGYMSSDGGSSIDLHDGRTVFLIPDCSCATAAGQQGAFGTNPLSPGAPRSKFLRNMLLMASAYGLEAATMSSHTRGTTGAPSSFFPDIEIQGQSCHRWPYFGWCLDDKLVVVGGAIRNELGGGVLSGNGFWVCLFDNISGAPSTWAVSELKAQGTGGGLADLTPGSGGFADMGDGYVLLFGLGPGFDRTAFRVSRAALKRGDMRRREWWDHKTGWRTDSPPNLGRHLTGGRPGPRGSLAGYPITSGLTGNACNDGTIHRRPDGKFQWTGIFHFPFVIPGSTPTPAYISYALTPGTELAPFPPPTDVYAIPPELGIVYACSAHPQLTWPGMGPNDQAWSFFGGNSLDPVGANRPQMVKAVAIT